MSNKKYQVRIENFEGPLDLLLHLIDKNEVEICDIPIAKITDQYLEYINEAKYIDLDIASEFLVMASTLLLIKAKMLLPKPEKITDENFEDDPREELIARLLKYKQYKEAASYLKDKEQDMSKVFIRKIDEAQIVKDFGPINPVSNVSLQDLLVHYKAILYKEIYIEPIFEVSREEIGIAQCMANILDGLTVNPRGILFTELFDNNTTRLRRVVTFLALLELIKTHKLRCRQNGLFGEIIIFISED